MDGTPITNTPFDLWVQQSVFGIASLIWRDLDTFVRLNGGRVVRSYTPKGLPKKEYVWDASPDQDLINGLMSTACLRRNKADLLPDLPPKSRQRFPINSFKIRDELNHAIESEAAYLFPKDFEAQENLIEALRKCVDFRIIPPGVLSRLRKLLAVAKVPTVADESSAWLTTQESKGIAPKLVVMTSSLAAAELLHQKLSVWGHRVALFTGAQSQGEKESAVESFQTGELECLIVTIAAGGQGLTLTAADTMFFLDWDWSFAKNLQAEDRIHRSGLTSDKCLYVDFLIEHWLDQNVAEKCGIKERYHQTIEELGEKL
jgi:hypothetical protein